MLAHHEICVMGVQVCETETPGHHMPIPSRQGPTPWLRQPVPNPFTLHTRPQPCCPAMYCLASCKATCPRCHHATPTPHLPALPPSPHSYFSNFFPPPHPTCTGVVRAHLTSWLHGKPRMGMAMIAWEPGVGDGSGHIGRIEEG